MGAPPVRNAFRRLRLNQGTDAAAAGVLDRAADWRAVETADEPVASRICSASTMMDGVSAISSPPLIPKCSGAGLLAGVPVAVAVAVRVEVVGPALGGVPGRAVRPAVPVDAAVPAGRPHRRAVLEAPAVRT